MAFPALVPILTKGAEYAFYAYNAYQVGKELPTVIERTKAVIDGNKEQIAPLVIDTASLGLSAYFGGSGVGKLIESVKGSKLLPSSATKALSETEKNVSIGKVAELGKNAEIKIPGVSKAALGRITEKMSQKAIEAFEKDVITKPELAKLFLKNPDAIKCYENALGTKYRTDVSLLRYTSNNADKYLGKGFKDSGQDLVFKDVRNTTKITDKSGHYLGKIVGKNENGGFIIDIGKAERNTLANLYPMSNAKYIEGNNYVITDKYGRPVEYRVLIDKNVEAADRDKLNIFRSKTVKDYYDVNGNQVSKIAKNDEGGHMIAHSWGGSSNALNIIPQNFQINRGGIWRQSEQCGLEVAREGNKVERIIKLEYPDKISLRPSEFILEQKVNGSYDVNGGLKPTTITNNFE